MFLIQGISTALQFLLLLKAKAYIVHFSTIVSCNMGIACALSVMLIITTFWAQLKTKDLQFVKLVKLRRFMGCCLFFPYPISINSSFRGDVPGYMS